jgi:hypothetical protein
MLMKRRLAQWSLTLLALSMAIALGGGLHESFVLAPLWSASPPSSFSIIQPGTGFPLQHFWVPVHAAITVFILVSLVLTWRETAVRRLLFLALACYLAMRVWSGLYFIPEMLAFQQVPASAPPSTDLSKRVSDWTFWTWFREPLDVVSLLCALRAIYWLDKPIAQAPADAQRMPDPGETRDDEVQYAA